MSARQLIAWATIARMVIAVDGEQLRIIRPKNELTDKIMAELIPYKPELLAELTGARCCGARPVPNPDDYAEPVTGADPAELVLACRVCPRSPTYWRRRP